MEKSSIITLCYRKIININNEKPWDQLVFKDSYAELKMQAQYYNAKNEFRTFSQLIQHAPNAQQLHFLTSAAVTPYISQLNAVMPDISNNLGRLFLRFKSFRFEIINSDFNHIEKHSVAVNFFSEELYLLNQIGSYLLTTMVDGETDENGAMPTDLFNIPPFLSICNIKL